MSQKKYGSNLIWGIILVGLGLIFLLENFGFDVVEHIWKLWPVILILWGWSKLRSALKSRPTSKVIQAQKNDQKETDQL